MNRITSIGLLSAIATTVFFELTVRPVVAEVTLPPEREATITKTAPAPAVAPPADPVDLRIQGPGSSYIKLSGLLQSHILATEDGAPDDGMDMDFYLRRMRLLVYGEVNPFISFFVETDNPNLGRGGNWSGNTFIQDAYVEFNAARWLQVNVGMILPPFSRHGYQSAISLLGIDYHTAVIRYPGGSHKVWRDAGVMTRGLLFNDRLEYRLGVFSGVRGSDTDPRNPSNAPRLTGRLVASVFDAEGGPGVGGMFTGGVALQKSEAGTVSTKKILSFGVSMDWQPNLNVQMAATDPAQSDTSVPDVENRSDYSAISGDLFFDFPLADRRMSLNGQGAIYYYNHGDRRSERAYYNQIGDTTAFTGWGIMGELGFRYHAIQPLVLIDVYNSTQGPMTSTGDYVGVFGGLNYYLLAHRVSFKLQGGATRTARNEFMKSALFQTQLFF